MIFFARELLMTPRHYILYFPKAEALENKIMFFLYHMIFAQVFIKLIFSGQNTLKYKYKYK